MGGKLQQTQDIFGDNAHLLACPHCGGALTLQGGSLLCGKGHCFDLCKKGYVNFAAGQQLSQYDKRLFRSRHLVLESGFFRPVLEQIAAYLPPGGNLLDVGCGEGYYIRELAKRPRHGRFFAMDLAKDAIALAAGTAPHVVWMVADLANIPLQPDSVDGILNVFTPANYDEFHRILAPGGRVIKILPNPGYLQQVRQLLGKDSYSNEPVIAHWQQHMDTLDSVQICYHVPVTPQQAQTFGEMTPLSQDVDLTGVDWGKIDTITIDVQLLVGRRAPK